MNSVTWQPSNPKAMNFAFNTIIPGFLMILGKSVLIIRWPTQVGSVSTLTSLLQTISGQWLGGQALITKELQRIHGLSQGAFQS